MEETTNKRDHWPTGLFDCCSGSNSFLFLLFFLLFFNVFLCFYYFEKKGGVGVEVIKNISLSFQFKINSFFFVLKKGGASLCLWGFLCPLCLQSQGWTYSDDLEARSSEDPMTESQFERYPPWSCRGIDRSNFIWAVICSCCCCLFGLLVGGRRHEKYSPYVNFEYYCSSQPCCCCSCCDDLSIEDCLIGQFCCCCSIIQVTMATDELFRMQSKVEGNVNIKRAH